MVDGQLGAVLRYIRNFRGPGGIAPTADEELLRRFVARRDEAAFAALVERHGPMVLSVCRRLLHRSEDVDDAFQATFLVLVRRADSLSRPELVGNWLYGVAQRIAFRLRANSRKRSDRERPMTDTVESPSSPGADVSELRPILDEELRRLPEKYRTPMVLHYLSGRTQAETAKDLGLPVGTVAGRLARARKILGARLIRRGVAPAAVLAVCGLAAGRAPAAVPVPLEQTTVSAAMRLAHGGAGSEPAYRLAEEVMRALFLARSRGLVGLVLMFGAILTGATALVVSQIPTQAVILEQDPEVAAWGQGVMVPFPQGDGRVDRLGDPLPPGAVARLGTKRGRHTDNLSALALSPDGLLLATRAGDDRVRIWCATTGMEIHVFGGPPGEPGLWGFAFAPDGKTLATCGADGMIRFYDPLSGRELYQALGNPRGVRAVAFSGDGSMLAVGGEDNEVDIWDAAALKELRRLGQVGGPLTPKQAGLYPLRNLSFSPNDKALAALYLPPDGDPQRFLRCLELRDVNTGRTLRRIGVPFRADGQLPLSSDGQAVFWINEQGKVSLRAVASGEQIRSFDDGVVAHAIARSDDGRTLAVASTEAVRLWEVSMGTMERVLPDSGNRACLAFSRDGQTLAAGAYDGTFQLWNTATGEKLLQPFPGHEGRVLSVASSPDGKTLATCCAGSDAIRLWQASTGREIRRWHAHAAADGTGEPTSLAYAPDGKTLASTGADRRVRLWDASSGKEIGGFETRRDAPSGPLRLQFTPDGKLVATCDADGVICLYTTAGKEVCCFKDASQPPAEDGAVAALALSSNGKLLAGSRGPLLRVWEIPSGREVCRLTSTAKRVTALAFSPDSKTLASAGDEDEVALWDVATGQERRRLVARGTTADRLHPDGYRNAPRPGSFNALCFARDGQLLIGGRADGGLYILDPVRDRPAGKVFGHKEAVTGLALCGDGKTVASASADRTVLVWDITALLHALSDRDH
jgi:RNA polymerase sigma factor (sigma-70 family)